MLKASLLEKLAVQGVAWPVELSTVQGTLVILSSTQKRDWGRLLKRAYGADTLLAGYLIFGRALLLEHLLTMQPNAQAWLHRARTLEGLSSLLKPFVQIQAPVPGDIHEVRADLLAKGLSKAAWGWLALQPRAVLRKLLAFGWTREAVFWANMLSSAVQGSQLSAKWLEAGRPYGLNIAYQKFLCAGYLDGAKAKTQLERILRMLPTAARAEDIAQYECILDAFLSSNEDPDFTLVVDANVSWKGLMRQVQKQEALRGQRAEQRLAQRALTATAPASELSWKPVFKAAQYGGIEAVELLSEAALIEEGILLSHCVGDGGYTHGCLSREHMIVSLRCKASGSRATLQLRSANGGWLIGQLLGQLNRPVPARFWTCAETLKNTLRATCH